MPDIYVKAPDGSFNVVGQFQGVLPRTSGTTPFVNVPLQRNIQWPKKPKGECKMTMGHAELEIVEVQRPYFFWIKRTILVLRRAPDDLWTLPGWVRKP